MKGALAGMLAALSDLADARDASPALKVKLLIVPDEEAEEEPANGKASAYLAEEGHVGEFVICGEPTNLEIGVQSKGVLVVRIDVEGRAAHGSTPWLGDNAILKAMELYGRIASCRSPRAVRSCSTALDQHRPDHRRRRRQQGARPLPDGRRHPLPARPGSGRDAAPGARAGRRR